MLDGVLGVLLEREDPLRGVLDGDAQAGLDQAAYVGGDDGRAALGGAATYGIGSWAPLPPLVILLALVFIA